MAATIASGKASQPASPIARSQRLERSSYGVIDAVPYIIALGGPLVVWALDTQPSTLEVQGRLWSMLALFCTIPLMARAAVRFRVSELRLPALFATIYPIMIILPTADVYASSAEHYRNTFLAATLGGYVLTIGAIAFVPRRIASPRSPESSAILRTRVRSIDAQLVIAILGGVVLVTLVYLAIIPRIPLLSLITGGNASADRQLAGATLGLQPVNFAMSLSRLLVMPFICAYSVARYQTERSKTWRTLAIASLVVGVSAAMITIEKSLVMVVILPAIIAGFRSRKYRITTRQAVVTLVIVLAFPLFVYTMFNGGVSGGLTSLGRRMFTVPSFVVAKHFEHVPANTDGFYGGASIPILSKYTSGGRVDIDAEIYQLTYGSRLDALDGGKANASYVSSLWAEFGWVGVIGGSVVLGVVLASWDAFFVRMQMTPGIAALWGVLALKTLFLTSTALWSSVASYLPGMIDLALVAIAFDYLSGARPR